MSALADIQARFDPRLSHTLSVELSVVLSVVLSVELSVVTSVVTSGLDRPRGVVPATASGASTDSYRRFAHQNGHHGPLLAVQPREHGTLGEWMGTWGCSGPVR